MFSHIALKFRMTESWITACSDDYMAST
jgi:hypothetical protein